MTRVSVDPELLKEAQRIGGHPTPEEATSEALRQYICRRKQLQILDLFGSIDVDSSYCYKSQRASR